MMDLTIDALLCHAIKAELESREIYEMLAKMAKDEIVKERFSMFASEEHKHERFLREIFTELFPGKAITLPEKSMIPPPYIDHEKEPTITELYEAIMDEELQASEFYLRLGELGADGGLAKLSELAYNLANMEKNHYHMLEAQLKTEASFEAFRGKLKS